MDPADRPLRPNAATNCAACGRTVPEAGVRVLAEREDMAFVEVTCTDCGSRGLAILVPLAPARPVGLEVPPGEAPPVAHHDVDAVRLFLEGYRGDLRTLVRAASSPRRGSAGPA